MPMITIAGGRITCAQCKARSKRTGDQCRAPALSGKAVCRTHGGLSTGPRTEAGRKRCAEAKMVHGQETRQIRAERRMNMVELARLEALARALGMIVGPRTRGRKPSLG